MSDNNIINKRFGRYLLLDHFVDGGMAKICRARYLGEQADKIVAIKMIQPQYSKDEGFKQMFMDEIKVTFSLLHPNIAQTYDYGMHDDQLFTAMEYVDGKNLKQFLDKLKERRFVFPVEISVHIIAQVCQGLHYAHTLTDKLSGKDKKIIHRDISPHNIMLTYDGAVKVIDFGIAKAESNSDATKAGTIKGKLSYLAPEYLEGEDLDPRYDEFSVGITLWEMLCSRKLFKAKNDLAVLKQIQECNVPAPSTYNPNVPKELDEIVLKALSKDRSKRFENLDQLNRALVKFLYSNYQDFNATDLAYFAKELFKDDIKEDREKLFEFGKIDITPFLEDMKNELVGGGRSESTTSGTNVDQSTSKDRGERILDFGFDEENKPAKTRTKTRKDGGDATAIALETKKRKSDATAIRTGDKTTSTKVNIKKKKDVKQDEVVKKSNSGLVKAILVLGLLFAAGYYAYETYYTPFMQQKKIEAEEKIKQALADDAESDLDASGMDSLRKKGVGVLSIENFDRYKQKLFVNGEVKELSVLGEAEIPFGDNIIIRIEQAGFRHYITKITMNEENRFLDVKVPQMELESYGFIKTSRACVRGTMHFELFGEQRSEKLPFKNGRNIAFPVGSDESGSIIPKVYNFTVKKVGEKLERRFEFTLKRENEFIDLCDVIARY